MANRLTTGYQFGSVAATNTVQPIYRQTVQINGITHQILLVPQEVETMAKAKDNEGMSPRPKNEPNTDTYRGKVGAAIRARREALDISVTDIIKALAAEKLKVKEGTYYAWEQGRNAVPIDSLPALSIALRTTIKKLLPNA